MSGIRPGRVWAPGVYVGLPSVKAAERRRHPRVPISGSARVLFQGTTLTAELFDASRDGARLEITAQNELSLKLNDQVLIQPRKGETSVAFLCKVRHVSLVSEDGSTKVFSVGLEHAAEHQNRPDLLALLLTTGIVSLAPELPETSVLGVIDQSGSVINGLRCGIRQSSLTRIISSKQEPPILEEVLNHPLAIQDDHWKVMIGIQSPAMNVEFSSFYRLSSARSFYSIKKNNEQAEIEDRLCHDFMREFCNLTAGAIKIWVERHAGSLFWQKDLRVQLPIQAKADNNVLPSTTVSSDTTSLFDAWHLKIPSGDYITCFVNITIRDWAAVKSLQADDETKEQETNGAAPEDEDVEFL